MSILLFKNNAASTLASPITDSAVSVTVVPGDGAEFPSPGAGQYFIATFVDAATELISEIVWVTARVGDTMTIQRGQEGTAPAAWGAGDAIKMLPTAGTMQALSQVQQTQAGAPNYAVDTGVVNGYAATLNPPVASRIAGLTVRIKASASNTGPSTLNLGAGSIQIVNPDGTDLGTGAIINGGIFEVSDDGTAGPYQLISANNQALTASGQATTGDFSWRPTAETKSGWVFANATTIGNAASNATQLASAAAANLFAWHWNNFSNTRCPVLTSGGVPTARGASAAADFAANRQITILSMRGQGMIGMDTMGGAATTLLTGVPAITGNATTAGSQLGEALHTPTLAEMFAHFHAVFFNDPTHFHAINVASLTTSNVNSGGSAVFSYVNGGPAGNTGAKSTGASISSVAGAGTANQTASQGSSTPFNVTSLSTVGTIYIKL